MYTEANAGTLNKIATRPASYRWMQRFEAARAQANVGVDAKLVANSAA
jgi:hypothetical protein